MHSWHRTHLYKKAGIAERFTKAPKNYRTAPHVDRIKGGKGDADSPKDFDPKQLKMGIGVEMEHTKDWKVAREIAMDHLREKPNYYSMLKQVHKESIDAFLGAIIDGMSVTEAVDEMLNPEYCPKGPRKNDFRGGGSMGTHFLHKGQCQYCGEVERKSKAKAPKKEQEMSAWNIGWSEPN
jgi:hypothetical protein